MLDFELSEAGEVFGVDSNEHNAVRVSDLRGTPHCGKFPYNPKIFLNSSAYLSIFAVTSPGTSFKRSLD